MITKLILRNFKSIREQTYEFTSFDLFVGVNNSGKSTILQALAIWQFCIDEFSRRKRSGTVGIQVVLPNFTALPVPEFNLLWTKRSDRRYPQINGAKKQEFILIEVIVTWIDAEGIEQTFAVNLRYSSPQAIYAIPVGGWEAFKGLSDPKKFPVIAFVPPFSGLETTEERRDDGPLRKQVGKAQPGSVLRNLLLRVYNKIESGTEKSPKRPDWDELKSRVKSWFSVDLCDPKYSDGVDTQITCEFKTNGDDYDIISGGSGFHQTLILLAFLYGYEPNTILLDEPDAHLHVNLQRTILDYFKQVAQQRNVQFLIATHAEELVRGVDALRIVSLLSKEPVRIAATEDVIRAMATISNAELVQIQSVPVIFYVEGERDERILRAWAKNCNAETEIKQVFFRIMGGGNKKAMKKEADHHFAAVRTIKQDIRRLLLFDYDGEDTSFHPSASIPDLYEWQRKNIENYLLVPDVWIRAALRNETEASNLFAQPIINIVNNFFAGENLTLPPGQTWREVSANIFKVVDGKRILYENTDSLFQRLRRENQKLEIDRETIAETMDGNEIHEDAHRLFALLKELTMLTQP